MYTMNKQDTVIIVCNGPQHYTCSSTWRLFNKPETLEAICQCRSFTLLVKYKIQSSHERKQRIKYACKYNMNHYIEWRLQETQKFTRNAVSTSEREHLHYYVHRYQNKVLMALLIQYEPHKFQQTDTSKKCLFGICKSGDYASVVAQDSFDSDSIKWAFSRACGSVSASGNLALVQYVIENKKDLNYRCSVFSSTPTPMESMLNEACRYGHVHIIKYLLSIHEYPRVENEHTYDACTSKHAREILELLLEKKIYHLEDALRDACMCGNLDMVIHVEERYKKAYDDYILRIQEKVSKHGGHRLQENYTSEHTETIKANVKEENNHEEHETLDEEATLETNVEEYDLFKDERWVQWVDAVGYAIVKDVKLSIGSTNVYNEWRPEGFAYAHEIDWNQCLEWACKSSECIPLFKYLIQKGANMNEIHIPSSIEDVDFFHFLQSTCSSDILAANISDYLDSACEDGNLKMIKCLQEYSVSTFESDQDILLNNASRNGHVHVAEYLLNFDFEHDLVGGFLRAAEEEYEVMHYLLSKMNLDSTNYTVDEYFFYDKFTDEEREEFKTYSLLNYLLIRAACNGLYSTMLLLIQQGATCIDKAVNVLQRNRSGYAKISSFIVYLRQENIISDNQELVYLQAIRAHHCNQEEEEDSF
jgi:hypothetical protein